MYLLLREISWGHQFLALSFSSWNAMCYDVLSCWPPWKLFGLGLLSNCWQTGGLFQGCRWRHSSREPTGSRSDICFYENISFLKEFEFYIDTKNSQNQISHSIRINFQYWDIPYNVNYWLAYKHWFCFRIWNWHKLEILKENCNFIMEDIIM